MKELLILLRQGLSITNETKLDVGSLFTLSDGQVKYLTNNEITLVQHYMNKTNMLNELNRLENWADFYSHIDWVNYDLIVGKITNLNNILLEVYTLERELEVA